MSRYIITGGCGLIGSAVVNCLMKRKHEIYILDDLSVGKYHWNNSPVRPELRRLDILDFVECEKAFLDIQPDIVIHLAAHHFIPFCEKNMLEAYRLNVQGTVNVLENACRMGVQRFFFASTGDVYSPSTTPHREADAVGPIYVYGHTKILAEQVCREYYETRMEGKALLIGRLFNAAGPRETNPHLLYDVTRQIVEGKRIIEVGNMWPKRDYVDVDSIAEAIVDATAAIDGFEVINIGSGQDVNVQEALATLTSVLPFQVEIKSIPERQRKNDRPYLCPDVTRLSEFRGRPAEPFSMETARKIFAEFPGVLE